MRDKPTGGLCIPYVVRHTADKGRGVFAEAKVSQGATVWKHVPGHYTVHNEQSLKALLADLSHEDAVYELTHIHSVAEFPGLMARVFDDGELINHSAQPTLVVNPDSAGYRAPAAATVLEVSDALLDTRFTLIAASDIDVGEELTLDYNKDPAKSAGCPNVRQYADIWYCR